MSAYPDIPKADGEFPVPMAWRIVFSQINDCFIRGDFTLNSGPNNVNQVPKSVAKNIENNILSYGDDIISLNDKAWDTSICRWQEGAWLVLVDLCTTSEEVSDLVMFSKVYENGDDFNFEVESVHVP